MDPIHVEPSSHKEGQTLPIVRESLKDMVDATHSTINHKRGIEEDREKAESPADSKRYKPETKEPSLNVLVEATSQGAVGSTVVATPFPFPYNTYNIGFLQPFSQNPIDSEQYQILMQQQQYRFMEGMRELQGREDDNQTVPARKSRSRSAPVVSSPNYSTGQYSGRFVLLEQPNVRQRKSYKNENRYVLPNPLTICTRDDPGDKLPRILEGIVSVSLVGAEGQDLPANKANMLESPDGGLTQPLDSNFSAHFSLKVLDTSEGTMFRLLFVINFTVEGIGSSEEKILSRPFQVYSNRKKHAKDQGQEKPLLLDMKPKEGPYSQETEIWIKGKGFGDRVVVTFGDKLGRIVETTDNLITVCAPARYDLVSDTPVNVVVANKYQNENLSAEKKFTFLYYFNP